MADRRDIIEDIYVHIADKDGYAHVLDAALRRLTDEQLAELRSSLNHD